MSFEADDAPQAVLVRQTLVGWLTTTKMLAQVLKRINHLIQDVIRNGNEGIGKPEPLEHNFAGYWSRRISDEHRLAYKIAEGEIRIAACRYHYGR